MSTETEPPQPPPLDFEIKNRDVFALPAKRNGRGEERLADAVAKLETDLDAEKEQRKEERFLWIFACSVLTLPHLFKTIDNTWLSITILMMCLIFLIGAAQKLGVDTAVRLLSWFLDFLARSKTNSDD